MFILENSYNSTFHFFTINITLLYQIWIYFYRTHPRYHYKNVFHFFKGSKKINQQYWHIKTSLPNGKGRFARATALINVSTHLL